MKIIVQTTILQQMVSKAVKGSSNNKMIPITSLMAIEQKDGVLTLTTTDATNTLTIYQKLPEQPDFYVVVPVDIFSKLIAKTTSEKVTLSLLEDGLELRGNGTYIIDVPLDETGNIIKFPKYEFDTSTEKTTLKSVDIKKLLTANKAALAQTLEIPCITGYYCGNNEVITTDTFKVCHNEVKLFTKPLLLPPELMELLAMVDEELVCVQRDGIKILFTTPTMRVYGLELEDMDEYPIEAIREFLNVNFTSVCTLSKTALLDVLSRLSLFVTPYDNNILYMTFNEDGVIISSKRSNGTEVIKYETNRNFKPFACCVNIELLNSQVSAQSTDVIELWYGHDKAIKMVSEGVTQIVALTEDDRMSGNG